MEDERTLLRYSILADSRPIARRLLTALKNVSFRVDDNDFSYHPTDSALKSAWEELQIHAERSKALIFSLTEGDEAHFYSIAMQIAAHEARMGHGKLAEEIRALIDKTEARVRLPSKEPIPLARPRGEVAELLSVSYPNVHLKDMVMGLARRKDWNKVAFMNREPFILFAIVDFPREESCF